MIKTVYRRLVLLSVLLFLAVGAASGGDFESHFIDKTLRLDYIFSGSDVTTNVALHKLKSHPQWWGKRANLTQIVRGGDMQVALYDLQSGEELYRESFSTLFHEWQTIDEAKVLSRSFENTFLLPYPKSEAEVVLYFRDREGVYVEGFRHTVYPTDVLIEACGGADYATMHRGGYEGEAIEVVIVPEGYKEEETSLFARHAQAAIEQILRHRPFLDYRERFNFHLALTPSEESGVSVPLKGEWRETLVSSHFSTFYMDRYLTTNNVFDLHDAIAGVPYNHVVILANTDIYGGGGIYNSYTLTTTQHKDFNYVVVHEFGHSFGGLADEYFFDGPDTFDAMYNLSVEPWEPNITTLVDFDSKWSDMVMEGTPIPTPVDGEWGKQVGLYEGGGYVSKGVYRPVDKCRMRDGDSKDFCPVCQRALRQMILYYTE